MGSSLDTFITVSIALLGFILGAIVLLIYQSGKNVSKRLEKNSEKENAILKDQINKLLLQGKGNGGEVDTRSYDKIVGEIE